MAIYTVVSTVTGPNQILQGTITVEEGSTYIIDPSVTSAINFVAPTGSPGSVSYTIEVQSENLAGGPGAYPITLGDSTSPTVVIGANIDATTYPFISGGVDGVHYQIGATSTVADLPLGDGDNGQHNVLQVANNAFIAGSISPGNGDTQLDVGDYVNFLEVVDFGSGQLTGTFGAGASFRLGLVASGAGDKIITFGPEVEFQGAGLVLDVPPGGGLADVTFTSDSVSTGDVVRIVADNVTVDFGSQVSFGSDLEIGRAGGATSVIGADFVNFALSAEFYGDELSISLGDYYSVGGNFIVDGGNVDISLGNYGYFAGGGGAYAGVFDLSADQLLMSVGAESTFAGPVSINSTTSNITIGNTVMFQSPVEIFGDNINVNMISEAQFDQNLQIGTVDSSNVTLNIGIETFVGGNLLVLGDVVDVVTDTYFSCAGDVTFGQDGGQTTVTVGDGFKTESSVHVLGDTVEFTTLGFMEAAQAGQFGTATTLQSTVTIGAGSAFNSLDVSGETMNFVGGNNLMVYTNANFGHVNGTSNVLLGDNTHIYQDATFGASGQNAIVTIGNGAKIDGTVNLGSTAGCNIDFSAGNGFIFGTILAADESTTLNLGYGWESTGGLISLGQGDDSATLVVIADMGPVNGVELLGGENAGDLDTLQLTFENDAALQDFVAAALAAGWTQNPDGSLNPQDAAGNNLPLSWSNLYISEWESVQVSVICFASGTAIKTRAGETPVENLRPGSAVLTLDEGYQVIRWIGSRRLSAQELETYPHLRPIRIRAGALGINQPEQDLMVSPQHRIFVRSKVAKRMLGATEVLVAAKHLLPLEGVEVAEDLSEVTYWHFLFDAHQVVYANGTASESLFTGPEALKSVEPAAKAEILAIFPELRSGGQVGHSPVRPLVSGSLARRLAERISKNRKFLVA